MSHAPRILAFAGSTRAGSWNKKLVKIAADSAREAGAEVTLLDLKHYPLPIFDQDLEAAAGLPENAQKLKALFVSHHGLLISSPEYNSSISALLKNTIDWVSRAVPGEPPMAAFRGKVASLICASPGALGGLRGLVHLRSILGNIGVIVLPDQVAISRAHEAFSADDALKDPDQAGKVREIGKTLAETSRRLLREA